MHGEDNPVLKNIKGDNYLCGTGVILFGLTHNLSSHSFIIYYYLFIVMNKQYMCVSLAVAQTPKYRLVQPFESTLTRILPGLLYRFNMEQNNHCRSFM